MPDREEGQPKRQDEVVDGEIIAELPDETLVTLPPVRDDRSEHLGIPKIKPEDEPVDAGRRQLLIRLGIGGAAALALGGSAALLLSNNGGDQRVVVLPNGAQVNGDGTLDVAQLVKQIDQLQTDLASTKTERDSLSTQLQAANTELTDMRPALQSAQALITLWQQLDAIGIDDLLTPALQVALTAFTAVQAVSTTLQTGITDVQAAIDQFIKQLPGPKAGLQWLQSQVQALATSLTNLGTQVQQAVEPVQPYAQMIANFITWILERLPFGVGDKAKAGLDAMNAIVGGLPAVVDGINQQVMDPLIVWFGDDQVRNVYGLLLDPVSKKLLDPARGIQTQLASFADSFQNKLVTPAQTALDQRAAIRKQIAELQQAQPTKTSRRMTGLI
jgi:hypothetical protein